MTLTFIQDHSYIIKQKLGMLPRPVGLFKLILIVFALLIISTRENSILIILMRVCFKPISFKLDMIINMTKLYILIPV